MDEHQGIVHHICALYANNREDHNDLFQEILFQLWKSFKSFKDQSKFSTWLYRVALNTAITHLRKDKKMSFTTLEEAENVRIESFDNMEEEIQLLYQSIWKLSKIECAIIMLYLEEYSYDDISKILGITANNVGVRINRIKSKLENMMRRK